MTRYYTIGEISRLFNIPISTLRFYEKSKLFVPEIRNETNGYRYYSQEQLNKLDIIYFLRELEFPTNKIEEALEVISDRSDLCKVIFEYMDGVIDRITDLNHVLRKIERLKLRERDLAPETGITVKKHFEDRLLYCIKVDHMPLRALENRLRFKDAAARFGTSKSIQRFHLPSMGAIVSMKQFLSDKKIVYIYYFLEKSGEAPAYFCDKIISVPAGDYLTVNFINDEAPRFEAYDVMCEYISENNLKVSDLMIENQRGIEMPPVKDEEDIYELQIRLEQ